MESQVALGIIAGNGIYPFLLARAARQHGVAAIHIAAFENETRAELADHADSIEWMRVGQLGRLLKYFEKAGVGRAIMAGQIAPKNLFDLRPDFKVLMLLGRLKKRNAETLFGAVADELAKSGVELLPATTYLEDCLAKEGLIAGPKPAKRLIDDIAFGFEIAKEVRCKSWLPPPFCRRRRFRPSYRRSRTSKSAGLPILERVGNFATCRRSFDPFP
jgi:UDP-2,3-diacylglucosamine hydrolase